MKGAATPTSLKQWLLTALVLELDPTAGTQHKTVAGMDLMDADNAGRGTRFIRERFNQYLTTKKNIPSNLASTVSHLLMRGAAPHLLVKDAPQKMTLGSPEWFNFTAAVNRIEWTAPGATANMTYQQIMENYKIQPISKLESQIQSYAQMNPLLDWAALNNKVDKNNYTLEQLKDSQEKLQTQASNTAQAINWLRTTPAPNRRDMALKVLREKFGPDIDYEKRFMVENELGGVVSGRHYSLVEIYEAGRLDENWLQEGDQVDFDSLRKKAKEPDFPVINDEFDTAIKADFNQRRLHTTTLFEDMLKKLPVEEYKSLLYGNVEFLNVVGPGGSSGMVITSVYDGVRRDFAVYPTWGQIVRIADIDPSTPMNTVVELEIDADAFKNGKEPRTGVKTNVVLRTTDQHLLDDNNEPWPLEVNFPAHKEDDAFSTSYVAGRLSKLAKVMIDSTYLNKSEFVNLHRNWSSNTLETATEPSDFFKALWRSLPGASSLEDLYHGQFLKAGADLAIDVAIVVATEGAGKLWGLAKSAASWAAAKVGAGFIEKFGAKEAESIAIRDMTTATTSESVNATSRLQGTAVDVTTPENVADGSVASSSAGGKTKISAIFQDDEWHAYNPKTLEAEGPALNGFVPEGSTNSPLNPLFGSSPEERQAQKELIGRFEDKVIEARKKPGYQKGYDTLNLDNIAGYTPNMGPKTIAKLIADSDFTAEQIGSLMRQRERIKMDTVQRVSEGFMKEMKSAGGTVRPMPQTLYLALAHIFSPGECAGLSTAMAMAIMDGTENTLIDNLAIAAARPNLPANAAFLESITKLENTMMYQEQLHGVSGALVPVDGIIKKMSKATSTTAWLISSDEHAMVAGVRVDPTNTSKKLWYFYEPSYGLAKFDSEKAMKAGVNKLLKNGPIGTSQVHFGTPSKPLYGVSVFNQNTLIDRKWAIEDVKKLSQPIGS